MISLRKILDPQAPQKVCVRAYELFLLGKEAPEIFEILRQEGFTARVAARAVTFLPSAFARVHYETQGIEFPAYFYPGAAAFKKGRFLRYSDGPVFLAAVKLAEQLRRDGDWPEVWKFVEASAEHAGVTKARSEGLTPTSFNFFIHEF
jgi:hypothetical protein